jgi:uncharacterized protein (TIGR04255 family)
LDATRLQVPLVELDSAVTAVRIEAQRPMELARDGGMSETLMIMGSERAPLPHFNSPPVVETILGVQFLPIPGFRTSHFGAFWKSLPENEWPFVNDVAPLPPQFERFGTPSPWDAALPKLQVRSDVPVRVQITNRSRNRMIQLQNGRLHFNWLGRSGEEYPRYEAIRDGFREVFEKFAEFLSRERIGAMEVNQWEVTYVNHIPKGTVWNSPSDWSFFRPLTGYAMNEELATGESFSGEWSFVIPPQRGRLHVNWQHGLLPPPNSQELISLNLTARGPTANGHSPWEAVQEGIDLGREVIVRAFASLMSESAKQTWELRDAST